MIARAIQLLACALVASGAAPARAQDAAAEHDELVRERRGLMIALAGWGGASAAAGALLIAAAPIGGSPTPEEKGFQRALGAMSLVYGVINLGIAVGTLVSLSGAAAPPARAAAFGSRRASTDVFAANAALDVLYVGVGGAMWDHGPGPAARGAGAGMLLQGSFLVAFDTAGAALLRK